MIPGSGELEFEEFITLASKFMAEEDAEAMQSELKEAFRLYDKEGEFLQLSKLTCYILPSLLGNGYITTATLKEILRELDSNLSNEELDGIITEIDTDGSGTVDYDGRFLDRLF